MAGIAQGLVRFVTAHPFTLSYVAAVLVGLRPSGADDRRLPLMGEFAQAS